ncbi:MAG: cytochrome c [Vicinamibacterales bacterium]
MAKATTLARHVVCQRQTGNEALLENQEECLSNTTMPRAIFCLVAIMAAAGARLAAQDAKAKGEKLFADQKCALCHSVGDKGNKKGPLDEVGRKLSAAEIRNWIVDAKAMTEKTKATRTPAMKQFNLKQAEVDSLVAYLQSLTGK